MALWVIPSVLLTCSVTSRYVFEYRSFVNLYCCGHVSDVRKLHCNNTNYRLNAVILSKVLFF